MARVRPDDDSNPKRQSMRRGYANAAKKAGARRIVEALAWLDAPLIPWSGVEDPVPSSSGPRAFVTPVAEIITDALRDHPRGVYLVELTTADRAAQQRRRRKRSGPDVRLLLNPSVQRVARVDAALIQAAQRALFRSRRFPRALPPLVGDLAAWQREKERQITQASRFTAWAAANDRDAAEHMALGEALLQLDPAGAGLDTATTALQRCCTDEQPGRMLAAFVLGQRGVRRPPSRDFTAWWQAGRCLPTWPTWGCALLRRLGVLPQQVPSLVAEAPELTDPALAVALREMSLLGVRALSRDQLRSLAALHRETVCWRTWLEDSCRARQTMLRRKLTAAQQLAIGSRNREPDWPAVLTDPVPANSGIWSPDDAGNERRVGWWLGQTFRAARIAEQPSVRYLWREMQTWVSRTCKAYRRGVLDPARARSVALCDEILVTGARLTVWFADSRTGASLAGFLACCREKADARYPPEDLLALVATGSQVIAAAVRDRGKDIHPALAALGREGHRVVGWRGERGQPAPSLLPHRDTRLDQAPQLWGFWALGSLAGLPDEDIGEILRKGWLRFFVPSGCADMDGAPPMTPVEANVRPFLKWLRTLPGQQGSRELSSGWGLPLFVNPPRLSAALLRCWDELTRLIAENNASDACVEWVDCTVTALRYFYGDSPANRKLLARHPELVMVVLQVWAGGLAKANEAKTWHIEDLLLSVGAWLEAGERKPLELAAALVATWKPWSRSLVCDRALIPLAAGSPTRAAKIAAAIDRRRMEDWIRIELQKIWRAIPALGPALGAAGDDPALLLRLPGLLQRLATASRLTEPHRLEALVSAWLAPEPSRVEDEDWPPDVARQLALLNHHRAGRRESAGLPRSVRKILDRSAALQREATGLQVRVDQASPRPSQVERLEKLRLILADPARIHDWQLRDLRRLLPRVTRAAGIDALERALDAVVREHAGSWLGATLPAPTPPEWDTALVFSLTLDSNRRLLRNLLRAVAAGDRQWSRGLPGNRRFLELMERRGLDTSAWLAPRRRTLRIGADSWSAEVEFDPLRILQMGALFGTCLTPGDINDHAAVADAAEINKHVLYVRDGSGHVVGRKLVAALPAGDLVGFYCYGSQGARSQQAWGSWIRILLDGLAAELARDTGLRLAGPDLPEHWEDTAALFAENYFDEPKEFDWWLEPYGAPDARNLSEFQRALSERLGNAAELDPADYRALLVLGDDAVAVLDACRSARGGLPDKLPDRLAEGTRSEAVGVWLRRHAC